MRRGIWEEKHICLQKGVCLALFLYTSEGLPEGLGGEALFSCRQGRLGFAVVTGSEYGAKSVVLRNWPEKCRGLKKFCRGISVSLACYQLCFVTPHGK